MALIILQPVHPYFLGTISSIAGAGPIVGPILGSDVFWMGPTWVWILIGAIRRWHDFWQYHVQYAGRSIADTMRD